MSDNIMRLQKFLSEAGVASRRKSEQLINQGAVTVNGAVASLGDKVNADRDVVAVNGKRVQPSRSHVYIMLNKPRGFITTMDDERGRKCVATLVADAPARVYPVGRLDKQSEGLLLFTNDGEFANAMTHPRNHVAKTYRVTVKSAVSEQELALMSAGMVIDGRPTSPARVEVLTAERQRTVLEITIYEGRNRQIRKMCEQLGLEVARLKRTAVGSLKLGMLQIGKWQQLTNEQVSRLLKQASGSKKAK